MSKDSNINFNSIKVRLEQTTLQDDEHNLNDFNSIKVRLERIFSSSLFLIHLSFQFHKGAIRTESHGFESRMEHQFQFHKGAIRTIFCALPFPLV